MKCVALSVVALVLVGGEASGAAAAAEESARAWLRSKGGQPNSDELAELKTENPSAYALVKALLVKQQLGLLDPRHPNKPMNAAAAPAVSDEDKASLAKMESEVKARAAPEEAAPETAAVYPEASSSPTKHDWFNWKPTDSATSDDQMVSSVLGEVAALKGGAAPSLVTKHAEASAASMSASESIGTSASVGSEENVAARSTSASAGSAKHDWFNWKPADSAGSDVQMIGGTSVSAEEKTAASSISTSRNLLASNAGSSALASEGAALGFDTGDAPPTPVVHQQSVAAEVTSDAPPTPVVHQQSAAVDAAAVAPAVPKKKNAFWGSLFDNVDRDIKPTAARPAPLAASRSSEPAAPPSSERAQPLVAAPQQAAPENSYLSEYGLGSASVAAQPRREPNHPNPYLEMSGMNPSAPQSSLISSRAKVEPATEATSNPYLKNLDLFG